MDIPQAMNEWGDRLLLLGLAPSEGGGLISLLGVTEADQGRAVASTSSYSTKPIRDQKLIGDNSQVCHKQTY
ncbi:hypothetical protein ACX0G7_15370 [Flavitalea antarctica]